MIDAPPPQEAQEITFSRHRWEVYLSQGVILFTIVGKNLAHWELRIHNTTRTKILQINHYLKMLFLTLKIYSIENQTVLYFKFECMLMFMLIIVCQKHC